jgi:hypothetical protein
VKYGLCSLTVETGIPILDSAILCAEIRRVRSGEAVVVLTAQVEVTNPKREKVGVYGDDHAGQK